MTDTFAQGRVKWFMRHTYTWRKKLRPGDPIPPELLQPTERAVVVNAALSGNDDESDVREAWGVSDPVYGPPILGKPCIYHDNAVELDDASGQIIRQRPHMRVPWDDPIADDDLVMEIIDGQGKPLVTGPLRVLTTSEFAPHGPMLYRDIPLASTQVED